MRILLLLLSILTLIGCNYDSEVPGLEDPKITLIFPVDESNIELEDIEFLWDLDSDDEIQFKLYLNSNFEEPIVDKSTVMNSTLVEELEPATNYSWEIIHGLESKSASFKTINPVEELASEYVVETYELHWRLADFIPDWDTTYVDTIYLTQIDEGINLKMASSIDVDLLFRYTTQSGELRYSGGDSSYIISASMEMDRNLQKISVNASNGGLGGGIKWRTEFNY